MVCLVKGGSGMGFLSGLFGGGKGRGGEGLFEGGSSLLFFFLLLVVILCNCGMFEDGDSLLFFFLLLVIIFCNCGQEKCEKC
jgi:hypothetical protein